MTDGRIKLLQAMPIFGGLRPDVLERFVAEAETVTRNPRQFFFREGKPADCLYVLETGTAEVVKSYRGRGYRLTEFGPGDCFGEMALIDLRPRSASVRAVDACSALRLSNQSLHDLQKRDLEQFALVMMNLGREVCRRLRNTDRMLFENRVESRQLTGELIAGTDDDDQA